MGQAHKQKWCKDCNKQVLATMDTANHVLHFLLTLFTLGLWIPIWFISSLSKWRCPQCGRKV